jgi:phage shock protein E
MYTFKSEMRIFVDVREPEEFAMGHVVDALNIPSYSLINGAPELNDVPKDAELVLYCRTGARSESAKPYFVKLGFTNVSNGINANTIRSRYF